MDRGVCNMILIKGRFLLKALKKNILNVIISLMKMDMCIPVRIIHLKGRRVLRYILMMSSRGCVGIKHYRA